MDDSDIRVDHGLSLTTHEKLRTVVLGDIVTGYADAIWSVGLRYALNNPRLPVNIIIRSDGGDVFEAISITSAMRDIRSMLLPGVHIIGSVHGNAMSGASYVLQWCDLRYAVPTSMLMVHGITQRSLQLDERDAERNLELLKYLRSVLAVKYTERSKRPREYWDEVLQSNSPRYFTAVEALDVGLIDEIK